MIGIDGAGPFAGPIAVALALAVTLPAILGIIRRFDAIGLMAGVLGCAVLTSLATLSAVIFGTTTRPWFWVWLAIAYLAAAIRVIGFRRPAATGSKHWGLLAVIGVGLAPARHYLASAPTDWDARSIWFHHASLFADPTTVYTEWPTFAAGSIDYPPLAPSWGAFSWFFGDSANDWIAQFATGALTLAALALLALLVSGTLRSRWQQWAAGFASATLVLAVIRGNGLNGYVDGLAAALLASLAVMAFVRTDPYVVGCVALAAALTKNESLLLLVVVVVPLYLIVRRSVLPLVPGAAAGAVWAIFMRLSGATGLSWDPGQALPGSEAFLDRIGTILRAWFWGQDQFGLENPSTEILKLSLAFWAGVAVLTIVVTTGQQARRTVLSMGLVAAAMLAVEVGIYLSTPLDLEYHLATSSGRLIMHPSMVLISGGLMGLVGLLRGLQPEDDRSTAQEQTSTRTAKSGPPIPPGS